MQVQQLWQEKKDGSGDDNDDEESDNNDSFDFGILSDIRSLDDDLLENYNSNTESDMDLNYSELNFVKISNIDFISFLRYH